MKSTIVAMLMLSASVSFAGNVCRHSVRANEPGGMMSLEGSAKGGAAKFGKCDGATRSSMESLKEYSPMGRMEFKGKMKLPVNGKMKDVEGIYCFQYHFEQGQIVRLQIQVSDGTCF